MEGGTPGERSRPTAGRVVASLALLVVAAVVLGAVLARVDGAELRAAWLGVRRSGLVWLLAGYVANHLLRVVRWHLLLGEARFPDSLLACLVGFLAVQVLPLRLGELVRPWVHARSGTPLGTSLAALAVERTLDVLTLASLLVWVALTPSLPAVLVGGVDVVGVARRSAGLAAVVLVAALVVVAAVGPRARRWPMVGGLADSMGQALRGLATHPRRAIPAVLLTCATWGSYFAYVAAALACFPTLPGGWWLGAFTATVLSAGTTALPTPGFFGSYEASVAAALGLFGAAEAPASAAALFLHVTYLLFTALVALPALVAIAPSKRASPS